MKIAIFDPNLARFGHHVHFNTQVLSLTDQDGFDVTYFDVDSIMQDAYSGNGNVRFYQVSASDMEASARASRAPLTSKEFQEKQASVEACGQLWKTIAKTKPDIVIVASEATRRKQLFGAVPKGLRDRVYAVVHPLWSVIGQLDGHRELREIYQNNLAGMMVLEPFLVDKLSNHGVKTFWMPHRSYTEDCLTSSRRENHAQGEKLRIGTVGVINDRRNHKFLIEALGQLDDLSFEYVVAGQLMNGVRDEVAAATRSFKNTAQRKLTTVFDYLDDDQFNEIVGSLDACVLAYDELRNLQASGAIYSMLEQGVPIIVPETDLFRDYQRRVPQFITTYKALDGDSLRDAIRTFAQTKDATEHLRGRSRDQFLMGNQMSDHQRYFKVLLETLSSSNPEKANSSLVSSARIEAAKSHVSTAEGYLLTAIETAPKLPDAYTELVNLRDESGDEAGASHIRTRWLEQDPDAFAHLKNRPSKGGPFELVVWPAFSKRQDLEDFLTRFAFHYAPISDFVSKVHYYVEKDWAPELERNLAISDEARARRSHFLGKLFAHPKEMFADLDTKTISASIVWKYETADERRKPFPEGKIANQLYKKPIWRVDEQRERFATSLFLKAVSESIKLDGYRSRSQESFERLAAKFTKNRVAVFGTGPSLSDAWNHDFSNVDTIAANSMVKNIGLLDHLKPKLIVCADPIFHAGVSTYAEEFREYLRYAVQRYGCSVMVPERDCHIYQDYFKDDGFDIFSVPLQKRDEPNYKMLEDFSVTSTGNILTLFLLQLAFSVADTVDIYGCDGRPKSENSYFWSHDKSAQLNDKMDDIQRAHPGFFNISYDDYYDEHCETLDRFLSAAEVTGKTPVSQTFSHIPALIKRQTGEVTNKALPASISQGPGDTDQSSILLNVSRQLLLDPVDSLASLKSDPQLSKAVKQALAVLPKDHKITKHFQKVRRFATQVQNQSR